jgi:hypothetical protein
MKNSGVHIFDPPPGLIREGNVISYNPATNLMQVQLTETSAIKGKYSQPFPVAATFPLIDSNGLFIGSLPAKNTPVTVAQGNGGQYYFVNAKTTPELLNNIPDGLTLGEILIESSPTSFISLDYNSNITLGSDINNIHIFAGSQQFPKTNLISLNFENENHFTQAYRELGGVIKRDVNPNPQASSFTGDTKLEDDSYDPLFHIIGLDPTSTANDLTVGPTKNPPLVEHREIVYEFQYQSNVDMDALESAKYLPTVSDPPIYTTPNRRGSRADTMSLTLLAPNFLIEEVKGTVVDIFGNILDLNRMPLPVGMSSAATLHTTGSIATTNSQIAYQNIRALERRSIAYHFEINARKDPAPLNQGQNLAINDDNYNAKLQRSRFSFDVDKEGQFKINVPASSEAGNISLLTRAENYSSFGTTDNGNPNQLWFLNTSQATSQDIFVDSFAAPQQMPSGPEIGFDNIFVHGSIIVEDNNTKSNLGPIDRISQFASGGTSPNALASGQSGQYNMRHGTAYHDILQTCYMQQNNALLNYTTGGSNSPNLSLIPNLTNIVSPIIKVGSTNNPGNPPQPGTINGNAGGRSGSINLDGSLELNIGANTVDRQSLWMDTAGGAIINLGRDLNQRSLMMGMDGDAYIQVGGYGPTNNDARFTALGQDGQHNGTLDIRVFSNGYTHMLRFDINGLTIMTPGKMLLHSESGTIISSDSTIEIDCENLVLQGRGVNKIAGGSI